MFIYGLIMLEGIVIWSKIGGWWKVIGVEYVDDDVHRGEYGGNIHIYGYGPNVLYSFGSPIISDSISSICPACRRRKLLYFPKIL